MGFSVRFSVKLEKYRARCIPIKWRRLQMIDINAYNDRKSVGTLMKIA